MLRWIFFSEKLPRTWEWWAVRETLWIGAAFTVMVLCIDRFFIPPDAGMEMRQHPVGIMSLCLTMWFWFGRKYSFYASMFFGWGIGLPASLMVWPPGFWGSIALSIVGMLIAVRAYSTGPNRVNAF